MMRHFLGVDVGGTNTRLLLMDDDGEFSGYRKIVTADWARQADPLVALGRLIAGHCKDRQVAQVMLGLPGILSRDRSRVLSLPFIPALDAQPVAALLADALALPVRMDKDVNHLLWWDLQQLPALPQVAVGLYLGTGMGNSLWLNGDFITGARRRRRAGAHSRRAIRVSARAVNGLRREPDLRSLADRLGARQRGANAVRTAVRTPRRTSGSAALRRTIGADHRHRNERARSPAADPGGGVIAMSGFPLALLEQEIRRHLRGPQPAQGLAISISRLTDETGSKGACPPPGATSN